MHNVEKWPNLLLKSCSVLTVSLLRYVYSFLNIMVNMIFKTPQSFAKTHSNTSRERFLHVTNSWCYFTTFIFLSHDFSHENLFRARVDDELNLNSIPFSSLNVLDILSWIPFCSNSHTLLCFLEISYCEDFVKCFVKTLWVESFQL